jgi:uncharacterized protein YigA (DUF484 family)
VTLKFNFDQKRTMTTLQADDIAHYLARHQDFFEQHPQLLSQMQLPHPHDGQAISLVERQSLMLRERVKALEGRVAEMVRHGQEKRRDLGENSFPGYARC